MLNNDQCNTIFALLGNAQALHFLSRADIVEISNKIRLNVCVKQRWISYGNKHKRLEFNARFKRKGLWAGTFWVWLLSLTIGLKTSNLLIDFDEPAIDYCKTSFKLYMDHRNSRQ